MLRIGFCTAGAVLVLASTASAVAAPAPSFNWTGLYIGANAGYDWSHGDIGSFNETIQQFSNAFVPGRGIVVVPGTTVPFPASSLSSNSFIGGGQVGYSFMSQNWVFGAEGDLHSGTKSADTSNSSDLPLTILQGLSTVTSTRSVKTSWGWSARGRIGYAWDQFQLYATGGLAGARVKVSGTGTFAGQAGPAAPCTAPFTGCTATTVVTAVTNTTMGSVSADRMGWTLGGGGEMALGNNLSLGLEYRHTDLGKKTYSMPTQDVSVSTPTITAPVGSTTGSALPPEVVFSDTPIKFTDDAVTLRLNFRL